MDRIIVFVWDEYEQAGGAFDAIGSAKTIEDAIDVIKSFHAFERGSFLDTITGWVYSVYMDELEQLCVDQVNLVK